MIIIKTTDGVMYVNEKKTQIVQWIKERNQVIIRSDPKGLNCVIDKVITVHYMTKKKQYGRGTEKDS